MIWYIPSFSEGVRFCSVASWAWTKLLHLVLLNSGWILFSHIPRFKEFVGFCFVISLTWAETKVFEISQVGISRCVETRTYSRLCFLLRREKRRRNAARKYNVEYKIKFRVILPWVFLQEKYSPKLLLNWKKNMKNRDLLRWYNLI